MGIGVGKGLEMLKGGGKPNGKGNEREEWEKKRH